MRCVCTVPEVRLSSVTHPHRCCFHTGFYQGQDCVILPKDQVDQLHADKTHATTPPTTTLTLCFGDDSPPSDRDVRQRLEAACQWSGTPARFQKGDPIAYPTGPSMASGKTPPGAAQDAGAGCFFYITRGAVEAVIYPRRGNTESHHQNNQHHSKPHPLGAFVPPPTTSLTRSSPGISPEQVPSVGFLGPGDVLMADFFGAQTSSVDYRARTPEVQGYFVGRAPAATASAAAQQPLASGVGIAGGATAEAGFVLAAVPRDVVADVHLGLAQAVARHLLRLRAEVQRLLSLRQFNCRASLLKADDENQQLLAHMRHSGAFALPFNEHIVLTAKCALRWVANDVTYGWKKVRAILLMTCIVLDYEVFGPEVHAGSLVIYDDEICAVSSHQPAANNGDTFDNTRKNKNGTHAVVTITCAPAKPRAEHSLRGAAVCFPERAQCACGPGLLQGVPVPFGRTPSGAALLGSKRRELQLQVHGEREAKHLLSALSAMASTSRERAAARAQCAFRAPLLQAVLERAPHHFVRPGDVFVIPPPPSAGSHNFVYVAKGHFVLRRSDGSRSGAFVSALEAGECFGVPEFVLAGLSLSGFTLTACDSSSSEFVARDRLCGTRPDDGVLIMVTNEQLTLEETAAIYSACASTMQSEVRELWRRAFPGSWLQQHHQMSELGGVATAAAAHGAASGCDNVLTACGQGHARRRLGGNDTRRELGGNDRSREMSWKQRKREGGREQSKISQQAVREQWVCERGRETESLCVVIPCECFFVACTYITRRHSHWERHWR